MKLEITKEKVLEAAAKCNTAKATLQTLFPECFDSYTSYTDIKTVGDAIKYLDKHDHRKESDLSTVDCIRIVCKAINKLINSDKFPDWKNQKQYKWWPYFTISDSGELVFNSSGYYTSYCDVQVGYLKTEQAANYVGKNFTYLYDKLKDEE